MEEKDLMNDFVNEEIVDIKIDNRLFKYKPITAAEENSWLNEYLIEEEVIINDEKMIRTKQDHAKLNELKIRNLVEVPYSQEIISKVIGINKSWSKLNVEQRWQLMGKLNPAFFSKIIVAMKDIDAGSKETKN